MTSCGRPSQSMPCCILAGSYVQATYLAGTLYEKARQRHGDHKQCMGTDCFQVVFLINGGLAVVAVVTSVLLWHRTRGLYGKVIEITKAERAKRGLQVWHPLLALQMAFETMCTAALEGLLGHKGRESHTRLMGETPSASQCSFDFFVSSSSFTWCSCLYVIPSFLSLCRHRGCAGNASFTPRCDEECKHR